MRIQLWIWRACLALSWVFASIFLVSAPAAAQVTIAQLSDTHLGEKRAPHAAENLRQAVAMINDRHPDAVVLSGDIGENPQQWQQAREILKNLRAPLYYVPGNHDVHSNDVERYRRVFGKDYYTFRVKYVTFVVIDSQLLGNYDKYEAKQPVALSGEAEEESERMLDWLSGLAKKRERDDREDVVIGIQHIPVFHDGRFPDPKPYWIISEPYRSREMKLLHELGIKDMLVGHWHVARIFERDGITWRVAPSTAWLPWGGELGFAMHSISSNGKVDTDFVALPGATP